HFSPRLSRYNRVGISHLGRFSQAYRRLFGETPSQTQRLGPVANRHF
ncbi:helix-turn-helix domain-containing protein, partial [Roseibium sp. RKSG952]|nr:helix-turn-helix domain-containing protein [Roseibium sp. RKSG952]